MTRPNFLLALPFAITFGLLPIWALAITYGGWWIAAIPLYASPLMSLLDRAFGLSDFNMPPETEDSALFWHRLLTWVWVPIQFIVIFGALIAVFWLNHLGPWESFFLLAAIGMLSGGVGIVYAHELIHQKNKGERLLGDILLGMVLYGHFRTEHVLVHHRHVGTPRDAVTARYNENFWRFWIRAMRDSFTSAWSVEKMRCEKRDRPIWHKSNPFWIYFGLVGGFLALAALIGGWAGLGLFLTQAVVAVFHLEITDYVEHYGLTRKHLGEGRYEPIAPRHSWNSNHKVTNYLLINLQRHSDHHYKPDRRYPLLQTYTQTEAPQLPHGYPAMTFIAAFPIWWRRLMNPKVKQWRAMYYPEIVDWGPYKRGETEVRGE
jgi:alkane 1-monooxygenase